MSASGSVRSAAAAVWGWIRSAPGTYLWLAALSVTTAIENRLSPEEARIWLGHRSTNLDRLGEDPIRVLIGSAFWIDGGGWLVYAVLFSLVHANAERWLGTVRWLAVVVVAHVGATYLSQGLLLLAIRQDRAPERAAFVLDVGVSYGLAGVAAVLAYRMVLPWRVPYVLGVLMICVPPVFVGRTFTDVGHAGAALIGFACYPLTRGRDSRWNPSTRWRAFVARRRGRHRHRD
ncbi:rhomboid-like protein [Nocardia sp. NPDC058633]|uniref:rhomboid-like protein n=1 Tax=Nocardia sp. NPDC058633 TaxID=3346568 RepID=UPI00364DEA64